MFLSSVKRVVARDPAGRAISGILLCAGAASGFALACHRFPVNDYVPLSFLLIVGIIAWYLGTWAALAGLLTGSVLLAEFLYAPLGSLRIAEGQARTNLVMMILFGVAIAYFYGDRETS